MTIVRSERQRELDYDKAVVEIRIAREKTMLAGTVLDSRVDLSPALPSPNLGFDGRSRRFCQLQPAPMVDS